MIGKSLKFGVLALCSLLFIQAKAQDLKPYPLDTINGEEVYRYRVERSIGLYRIGVNFDVKQSDIIRLNPQLRERGVHFDEVLLIPTGRPVTKTPKPVPQEEIKADTVAVVQDSVAPIVADTIVPADTLPLDTLPIDTLPIDTFSIDSIALDTIPAAVPMEQQLAELNPDGKPVIELALLLPFESQQQTKRSGNAARMLEFYQGALLALHDLQNDSLIYRLRVYDTERDERRVRALCDTTELDSVLAVLGLVYPVQIEVMSEWCAVHQVPLLLPFSDDIVLNSRPAVLQFNSTDLQEADSLCNWIIAQGGSMQCVTIDVKESDLASSMRVLRKQMKTYKINSTSLVLRDLLNDSAAYALDTAKENLIILHSDRFQHVRMLLPHLNKLQEQGYRLRLISQYSWQKEQIGLPQIYTSVFTADTIPADYDALWQKHYVNEHVSETPRYDLLGYDLMKALVGWLQGERESIGLQSAIRWEQVGEGGWQNAVVKVIEK